MRFLTVLFLIGLVPATSFAKATDVCEYLNLPNCRGITKQLRRNTFQSAPTSSTATNLNPSNVRFDKGLGVEAIAQANNEVLFGLASGTGKMGGALISGSMDNTFFGNRTPEDDEAILERFQDKKQFKNQKLTLALGGRLFSQPQFGLDVGVILKRHSKIRKINSGVGISSRVWIFHFGASTYRDDYDLDMSVEGPYGVPYSVLWNQKTFQESFQVTTLTGGMRIKNLAFDVASVNSKLDYYRDFQGVPETRILLYSASFYYGDFLLSAAMRKEHSGSKVFYPPDTVGSEIDKTSPFYGIQYSWGKHVIFGVMYNYFLLKEYSAALALFF